MTKKRLKLSKCDNLSRSSFRRPHSTLQICEFVFKVDLFVYKIELLGEYSNETFFEHFSKNEVISGIT